MIGRTRNTDIPAAAKICVDTAELQQLLCAGRSTAQEIGKAAGARIQIGRRVMWNVEKVRAYMDSISK